MSFGRKTVRPRSRTRVEAGRFLAAVDPGGFWKAYQTGPNKICVRADGPVSDGRASYTIGIKNGRIDTHIVFDLYKLRDQRPRLYEGLVEMFAKEVDRRIDAAVGQRPVESDAPPVAFDPDEADPYGDLAHSRKQKMSAEQQWRRCVMNMRRMELEYCGQGRLTPGATVGVWEPGIKGFWKGLFNEDISQEQLDETLARIKDHGPTINLGALLAVERDYYDGKFAPHSCATLEAQMDMLAGGTNAQEFSNFT